MQTPVIVEIDDDKVTTDNVEHVLIATKHQDRYDVLKKIMNIIDPYICIIFANKRDEVAKSLNNYVKMDLRLVKFMGI